MPWVLEGVLMGLKSSNFLFLIIISLYFFISETNAQDSLYLVGTITGESYENRITDVKGIGDINGDGYDDFMISMRTGKKVRDEGIVKLYLGSADGNLIPDITFHYPGKDSLNDFGENFSGIGDVNGDGYNDFIILGIFADWGFVKGKAFLYLGGAVIDTIPIAEFHEPWIEDGFGNSIEGVGDINKDGYDDFEITSDYNWTNARGYAYLFWGGDTISWNRSLTFTSDTLADFFGESAANIGDVNNDGFDDIAVGATVWASGHDTGKVYIFYGGSQMDNKPDVVLSSNNPGDEFGRIIKNADDINNDGTTDFCIVSDPKIFIYPHVDLNNFISIDGSLLGFGGYVNIEADLDINADGYKDFVIGNTNHEDSDSVMVGGAFIYLGNKSIDTVYKYKLEGENKWDEFSKIMSHADINGDGFDEILIMAPGFPDYENPLGKVYIYSYKKITDVKDNRKNIPGQFKLYQNYPNPFNPTTTVQYSMDKEQFVKITIYDVLGREIVTLVNEEKPVGEYKVEFDASKYNLSSGVYFCELKIYGGNTSANGVESQRIKMVLIK